MKTSTRESRQTWRMLPTGPEAAGGAVTLVSYLDAVAVVPTMFVSHAAPAWFAYCMYVEHPAGAGGCAAENCAVVPLTLTVGAPTIRLFRYQRPTLTWMRTCIHSFGLIQKQFVPAMFRYQQPDASAPAAGLAFSKLTFPSGSVSYKASTELPPTGGG